MKATKYKTNYLSYPEWRIGEPDLKMVVYLQRDKLHDIREELLAISLYAGVPCLTGLIDESITKINHLINDLND